MTDMTDAVLTLVERLRAPSGIGEPMDHMAMEEAAARIETLEAALREARAELFSWSDKYSGVKPILDQIDAALAQEKEKSDGE